MLFHEVYGAYYKAAAELIRAAQQGTLNENRIRDIADKSGLQETGYEIEEEMKAGNWPFIDGTTTPLKHDPERPWTTLELRWLKTIMMDPRIRLFIDESGKKDGQTQAGTLADAAASLSDVEPLYDPDDIIYFDRYRDGDHFTDPRYIRRFRMILQALREKRRIAVKFRNRGGRLCRLNDVIPLYLEYSDRDDKFRLYGITDGKLYIINLGRTIYVKVKEKTFTPAEASLPAVRRTDVIFLVRADTGTNALERSMMQFCHYQKEVTEEEPDKLYKVHMEIDQSDESDVLIQLLSFGPDVKLLSPGNMVEKMRERIRRQAALFQNVS